MEYYEDGAVSSLVLRGEILHAEIEGSQYIPYQVQVRFDAGKVADAYCDCPYDWGGWCKHIVAVLLTCIHAPERVEQKESLETKLTNLSREDLLTLLIKLLKLNPKLADQVEGQISLFQSSKETQQHIRTKSIDPAPFRRQVRDILHSLDHMRPSEAYWYVNGIVSEVNHILDQAHALVKADDGRSALVVLEAITDEYVRGWLYLDDSDGFAGGFFSDLGRVWTEAILSADLTAEEGKYWADQLSAWQAEVEEYGIDEGFDAAQGAALQGWNDPVLQNILQGESSDSSDNILISPWYEDNLIEAQLSVLEYQKRYEEYLNLAKEKGEIANYLTMLVHLNRIPEAVEYGKKYLTTATDTLIFVQSLQEAGEIAFALEIAEQGLSFQGIYRYQLAGWLRNLAIQEEKPLLALRAGLVAFKEQPGLDDYLLVSELAAENWSKIRPDLLEHLAQYEKWGTTSNKVDIYLHEGMVSEAMKIADTESPYYDTLERVVDAAIQPHPDWAIRHSQKQAEAIMNPGTSKHYHHAIKWLTKAKAAYKIAGQEEEWQTYLSGLLSRHSKKYKLRPMLEALE
jgi:uncharacterized Zn finger protein